MSTDDLESWQKHADNPVIAAPPPEIAAHSGYDFRDPYVWREDGAWWMVIGARREGVGGLVLLYRSLNLTQWEFVRVLLAGDEQASPFFYEGAMWECPNLLDFGARRALIVSVQDAQWRLQHAAYFSGPIRPRRTFTPDAGGVLVHGHSFYAPQATRLADGRILLFGWLRETRPLEAAKSAGLERLHVAAADRYDGGRWVAALDAGAGTGNAASPGVDGERSATCPAHRASPGGGRQRAGIDRGIRGGYRR